jgi:hypothetical protein
MAPATRFPSLPQKISQMRLKIAPIVHVETGHPPPQFPFTMLQLFLLTEDQLDAMACYYSQSTHSALTHCYPQTMDWNSNFLTKDESIPAVCRLSEHERLKVKMRMFAKFIGLRAETPNWERERQVEILKANIDRSIDEEEERQLVGRQKFYGGPALP